MISEKNEDVFSSLERSRKQTLNQSSFQFKELDPSELEDYPAFLIGNDRPLNETELESFQMTSDFLLVGTSLFRSIDFACRLASTHKVNPKVIIVDNSRQVIDTWAKLKSFFEKTTETDAKKFLEDPDDGFLEFIFNELQDSTMNANLRKGTLVSSVPYFRQFFRVYSVEQVRSIILKAQVLRQDWGNDELFNDIKRLYPDRPIVAYPSNIISCCKQSDQCKVLKSISTLQPSLCIFSNLDPDWRVPTMTYMLPKPTIVEIGNILKLEDSVVNPTEGNLGNSPQPK
jgi:hypothetical protein